MQVQDEIRKLITEAVQSAIHKEDSERAAGKELVDNPVARLLLPLGSPPPREASLWQDILLLNNESPTKVVFGTTSYLTSRRMWRAYPKARALAGADLATLYELFHVLPGTAALVERDGQVLVGVRSAAIGGTHSGLISVPAGLMEPDELIEKATLRELNEETGISSSQIIATVAADNPDAPNVTFVSLVRTQEKEVVETPEAKGKKFLWVPRLAIIEAAQGASTFLAKEIARQGVESSGQIAPDILSGIRQLYGV